LRSLPLSTLALILGIIGLVTSVFAVGVVFGVAAVILGHLGLRREPDARSIAIAGLTTGYISVAVSVIWGAIMLAAVLIPIFAVGALAALATLLG
jgi:uncharacterized membrane protein